MNKAIKVLIGAVIVLATAFLSLVFMGSRLDSDWDKDPLADIDWEAL